MIERDMARIGRHLFRWRKAGLYSVIAAGAFVILVHGPPFAGHGPWGAFYDGVWLAVAAIGTAVRIVASGYAPPGTSGQDKTEARAATLNTTGLYSIVRNPLYLGRILIFTALGFLTGVPVYGLVVLLLAILHYERVVAYEESFLGERFGAAFAAWAAEVPALLPRVAGWVPAERRFWPRRAVRRETNKVFFLVFAILLFDLLKMYRSDGVWEAAPVWIVLFAVLLVARLGLSGLKRFTRYFEGVV